jgi:hypothetical protein
MKPSTEAKRRYNKIAYGSIQVFLEKELVENFKRRVKLRGDTQADVIRVLIEEYLEYNGHHYEIQKLNKKSEKEQQEQYKKNREEHNKLKNRGIFSRGINKDKK